MFYFYTVNIYNDIASCILFSNFKSEIVAKTFSSSFQHSSGTSQQDIIFNYSNTFSLRKSYCRYTGKRKEKLT